MPIQHAMKFIKEAGGNKELRSSLYEIEQNEILPELEKKGFSFSYPEFEESVNMLHVQCQTEDEADELFQVVNWFRLLTNFR